MKEEKIKFSLFNFDHNSSKPRHFEVGPFKIEITEEHCRNLKKLRQNKSRVYTINDGFKRIIIQKDGINGDTIETAVAHIQNSKIDNSMLYPEVAKCDNVNDLCVLLSFLTGRKVYLKNEIEIDHSRNYHDPVVAGHYFYRSPDVWNSLSDIIKIGFVPQFYNLTMASCTSDLFTIAAYGNSVLDEISTQWCAKNGKSSFNLNNELNGIKKELIEELNKQPAVLLAEKIKALKVKKVKEDIVDDITARINKIKQPSAIYKLKKFLTYHDLYPAADTKEYHERLKWINVIRNKFVHSGDIPSVRGYEWSMMAEITTNITFLVIAICRYYFAHEVMKIEEYRVRKEKEAVRKYFETGTFRGKKVFEESYEAFMERAEQEWLQYGRYLT